MGDVTDDKILTPEVELGHGFKYAHEGAEVTANFIRISAYNMKQMSFVDPIKEIVMKAMGRWFQTLDIDESDLEEAKEEKKSKKKDGKDPAKMEGTEIMGVIVMHCDEGDLGKFHVHMRKLLTNRGVAKIDGVENLTGAIIDEFNPKDFDKLCGEYVGNFII